MTWDIDPTHSHVSFAIRVMSVSTTRGHFTTLRGRLHVDEQNPTITFASTHVEHIGAQDYKVTGNLTLHGVTRPITFDVHYHGQNSMMGARTGLRASATINRHDFGLGRGAAVRIAASSMVSIEIDLEAVPQSVEVQEEVAIAE
jgi:polyisoprenoid-binding protein YceI